MSCLFPLRSRFHSLILCGALVLAAVPVAALFGQENVQQQPEVANAKFQFEGSINSPAVFVRSGPGENYYPTQKLDKGASVTVVGIKFDWLKITPPDGSFCYVAKAFIERRGDGKTGRVSKPDVNVRAGSLINAMKTTVQARLAVGDDVEILDEVDEYFKIKPPVGAYLYVNKQFVDAVRPLATTPGATAPAAAAVPVAGGPTPMTITPTDVTPATPGTIAGRPAGPVIDQTATAVAPTGPATQPAQVAIAVPTTQPELSAEERFGALETEFNTMTAEPLPEQNVEQLSKKYQAIAKADGLSDTLKRVVDFRIATLKVRGESQVKLAELKALEKVAADREVVAEAEKTELEEQLKKTQIEIYAAVGTVQPSSLQLGGGGTLYRLTDPANGRTVIYVRSTDNKMSEMIGQFVGVKGTPGNDPQLPLRIITPTVVEKVDITKVENNSIAAQIIPPSLIGKGSATSSTAE